MLSVQPSRMKKRGSISTSYRSIRTRFREYAFDDIARSLFVFTTWLPNIASPVKALFLYVVLESLKIGDFKEVRRIETYEDFIGFCEWLIETVPSFPSIEDYVPEPDWGQVKYFFENAFYRVLYGSELENIYDFHSCFEIIHGPFEEIYAELTERSPMREFEACLTLQDNLIQEIRHQPSPEELEIRPGDLSVPSEQFWQVALSFVDRLSPELLFEPPTLAAYTRELDTSEAVATRGEDELMDRVFRGLDCRYYFLKSGDKYYPVLPRRFFLVLFEAWGKVLAENYAKICEKDDSPEIGIGLELHKYIRQRVEESEIYELVATVDENLKPSSVVFTTAIHTGNRLFLIHVAPPSAKREVLEHHLREIASELRNSLRRLSQYPTRLGLLARTEIVEFRSGKESETLNPCALIVIPFSSTDTPYALAEGTKYRIPEDLPATIMRLDEFLGIIDEIHDAGELISFFEYVEEVDCSFGFSPINTALDQFASYRDFKGVLVPGASEPNMVLLDPHWGSNFRYESLSRFYNSFPQTTLFGHPRSWTIARTGGSYNETVLASRSFLGYAYYQRIGDAHFFVRSPAHLMTFEQGQITDLLMQSLSDGLAIYATELQKLGYFGSGNRFDVIFFPSSVAQDNEKLKHIRHLIPQERIWELDITTLEPHSFGLRIVFNEERALSVLHNAKDRSAQIELLVSVFERINVVLKEEGFRPLETRYTRIVLRRAALRFLRFQKKPLSRR
jgi:hypothetical protein